MLLTLVMVCSLWDMRIRSLTALSADKQLELKQAEDKLKDTQDKLDRLKKVTGTLMNNTQLVQGIVGRIGKFEDIWKAVRHVTVGCHRTSFMTIT